MNALLSAAGLAMLVVAAGVSNASIEHLLLGDVMGRLSWGATLFRVLLGGHGAALMLYVFARRRRAAPTAPAAGVTASSGSGPAAQSEPLPWVWLLGLSAAALALRLPGLGSCLWFDEVITLIDFVRLPLGETITRFPNQNQHMLFTVLAHAASAMLGESAWTIRLPSVLFGVASLWALFLLGRRLVGRHEALLACALVTVSYHHVWFSQNARGYMALLFFATLATWLWCEAALRRSSSWYVAYAIAVALGMWTHLTMVFVPATHALLYFAASAYRLWTDTSAAAFRRELANGVGPLLAWALAASLTLQLYALALPEFLHSGLHEVSKESEWTSPFWVVRESLRSLQIGFGALAVVLCGIFVAGAGWLSLMRRNAMAAWALVLPPLLGGAVMITLGHNLWPRFFFFAMSFAVLIAVHGAMTVPRLLFMPFPSLERRSFAAGTAAVLIIIAASAASLPRAYALPKQDFTGARDYVDSVLHSGDAVVAVGLAGVAYSRYFAPHWRMVDRADDLVEVTRSHPRVWLVYTLPVELAAYRPEVWQVVDRDFEVVKRFPGTLGGGEVTVCRTGGDAPLAQHARPQGEPE